MHDHDGRKRAPRARRALSALATAATLGAMGLGATGCARGPAVMTDQALPLRRVVVYRNGVGYFERQGRVAGDSVRFRVLQSEVGDFLATLAVMEQGGSSVRAAAFPMPPEPARSGDEPVTPPPDARREVSLALDGRGHDLVVGYTVETPIWRPSYRLVFNARGGAQVQAWGIVQNLSGEDWRDVRLSLVAGAPVSFRSELAQAVIPQRPVVTDRGAVIDAVPLGETTLAEAPQPTVAATAPMSAPTPAMPQGGYGGGGGGGGGGRTRSQAARRPMAPSAGRGAYDGLAPMEGDGPVQAPPPPPPPPPMSQAPRNLASLAALAVQGGATRYDLPNRVTVPDRSATMVMLAARDLPGERMYLFAPDPGVGDSTQHPFHVARFENRTGAMLERGPIAIFEEGAFLGQGLLEPLPDAATTTVPFALERGLAVEHSAASAMEGARLVRMLREVLTIERFLVTRTIYRVRNGLDRGVRVMLRHPVAPNQQLFEPPAGTETSNGNALVPVQVDRLGRAEIVVVVRTPIPQRVELTHADAVTALEAWLAQGNAPAAVAQTVRAALDLRRQMTELTTERDTQVQRRDDLQQTTNETRENLRAIQRNAQANDLRQQLTARLARSATELDQITRRIVELDTQIGERRVRLAEAVRGIDIDTTARPAATPAP
jgi:hypothetical protein